MPYGLGSSPYTIQSNGVHIEQERWRDEGFASREEWLLAYRYGKDLPLTDPTDDYPEDGIEVWSPK